jgi:hypothetical protein
MSGGWRISEEAELAELRRTRRAAREQRTEQAWNEFAAQVDRCHRLGIFEREERPGYGGSIRPGRAV